MERENTYTIHSKALKIKHQKYSYLCRAHYLIFFFPVFLYIFPTFYNQQILLKEWKLSNKILFLTVELSYMEHNFFRYFYEQIDILLLSRHQIVFYFIAESLRLTYQLILVPVKSRILSFRQMYLPGLAKYLLKLVFCPFIFISLWRKRGDERIIEREREKEIGQGKV